MTFENNVRHCYDEKPLWLSVDCTSDVAAWFCCRAVDGSGWLVKSFWSAWFLVDYEIMKKNYFSSNIMWYIHFLDQKRLPMMLLNSSSMIPIDVHLQPSLHGLCPEIDLQFNICIEIYSYIGSTHFNEFHSMFLKYSQCHSLSNTNTWCRLEFFVDVRWLFEVLKNLYSSIINLF